jgi:hypothetical protein
MSDPLEQELDKLRSKLELSRAINVALRQEIDRLDAALRAAKREPLHSGIDNTAANEERHI